MLLIRLAGQVACFLCGEVHSLRIHAVLGRKVRSPETGENADITIISIICRRAKRRGRQYTKRLLPPFVTPFCQIGREGVLAYLRRFPDGRMVYRIASAKLGARDPRTIRRHLEMGKTLIGEAAMRLARLLSEVPAYARLPQRRLQQSEVAYLDELSEEAHRARRRAHGTYVCKIPPLAYVHLIEVFRRCWKPLAPPLSSVVRAVVFHDSS